MSFKAQSNGLKEAIEGVKVQRLGVKLQIEQEGLRADYWNLQKTQIGTQIAGVGVAAERAKLSTAQANLQISQVRFGKAQDKLGFEQADRMLAQQEYGAKLQLKSVNIAALREDVRHQTRMIGGASNMSIPAIGGWS